MIWEFAVIPRRRSRSRSLQRPEADLSSDHIAEPNIARKIIQYSVI